MPGTAKTDLEGLTVLLVEDTVLVADLLTDVLQAAGCQVVGPVGRLAHGLALAARPELDGALLDVNLAGQYSFPIADALTARGVPFIFLTGYGDSIMPPPYRDAPRLAKPCDLDEMLALVERCCRPG